MAPKAENKTASAPKADDTKTETTTLGPPTGAEVKVAAEPQDAGATDSTFAGAPKRKGQDTPGIAGQPHQERSASSPAPTTVEVDVAEADVIASHQRARGVSPAPPAPTRPEEWEAHDAGAVQQGTEDLRKAAKKSK